MMDIEKFKTYKEILQCIDLNKEETSLLDVYAFILTCKDGEAILPRYSNYIKENTDYCKMFKHLNVQYYGLRYMYCNNIQKDLVCSVILNLIRTYKHATINRYHTKFCRVKSEIFALLV